MRYLLLVITICHISSSTADTMSAAACIEQVSKEIVEISELPKEHWIKICNDVANDHNTWHSEGAPTFIMHKNHCSFGELTGPYPDGCIPKEPNFSVYLSVHDEDIDNRMAYQFGRVLGQLKAKPLFYPNSIRETHEHLFNKPANE